jgi:hypothetical protein
MNEETQPDLLKQNGSGGGLHRDVFPLGLATAYGLYASAAAISLLFVGFAMRETKGKTLEEMSSKYNINH